MKVIIILVIFCCVAVLSSDITYEQVQEKLTQLEDFLKDAARERKHIIKSLLRLCKDGDLGKGSFALTFKAEFVNGEHTGKKVAIKFTPIEKKELAEKEYEIYTYLGAINNPIAESFGVPAIYYYNNCLCGSFKMMAMTLMQPKFNEKHDAHKLSFFDIIFIFREVTRVTKYLHFAGICHNDLKIENIMFDRHRLFIIDYNLADKMDSMDVRGGTPPYLSRGAHMWQKRSGKDDWESFLYAACHSIGIKLGWFNETDPIAMYALKNNTERTLQIISKTAFEPELIDSIYRFAQYVFVDDEQSDGYPNYDAYYKFVEKVIKVSFERYDFREPLLGSWLDINEVADAENELSTNPPLPITLMQKPVPRTEYPPVDPDFFLRKYHPSVSDISHQLQRQNIF